jgi:hypothetical protein
MHVWKTEP